MSPEKQSLAPVMRQQCSSLVGVNRKARVKKVTLVPYESVVTIRSEMQGMTIGGTDLNSHRSGVPLSIAFKR